MSNFTGVDFAAGGFNLNGVTFGNANLTNASIANRSLGTANLTQVAATGLVITGADLSERLHVVAGSGRHQPGLDRDPPPVDELGRRRLRRRRPHAGRHRVQGLGVRRQLHQPQPLVRHPAVVGHGQLHGRHLDRHQDHGSRSHQLDRAELGSAVGDQPHWTGTGLAGAGVNLSGQDLTTYTLRQANVTGLDLSGATLAFMDLTSTTFSGANLTGAILTGATIEGRCSAPRRR
ncbi:MAG: pentapeptide repeat-containing protein [Acidimicrobiales bacterium]